MLPTLTTERLVLRTFKLSDSKEIQFLRSDAKVNALVKRPLTPTEEDAKTFILKILAGIAKKEFYNWGICTKESDKLIGTICLWNFSKDRKIAEVGYDLHPKAHGKGIMHEALNAVLSFGKEKLQIEDFEAYTHYANQKSIALLERNGFRLLPHKKDADNKDNVIFELKFI